MSNEAGQPFGSKRPDVTGAIELMQASLLKVGRVADVVQVGCGDQVGAIFAVEDRSYGAGALADSSDVLPSIAERREQAFSLAGGPVFKASWRDHTRGMHTPISQLLLHAAPSSDVPSRCSLVRLMAWCRADRRPTTRSPHR
jgi:hypothetical protein